MSCAGWRERKEGTGKEQGREARFTENVPGDLNKESFAPCFGRAFLFFISFYFCLWYDSSILTQVNFDI